MAGGWSRDGAVQDQIDASVNDAVQRARAQLSEGASSALCEACEAPIPIARQRAVAGVKYCIDCQELEDKAQSVNTSSRRASKDSLLR